MRCCICASSYKASTTNLRKREELNMRKKWYFVAPAAIVGIALFIFIGGELVMRLWNWLLPGLFGWHLITFWQAIAILALCRILFGRIGGRGFRGSGFCGRIGGGWGRVKPGGRR